MFFFIMQVVTSQNKMKILDVVILLLSVVNAQSKYVYIHVAYNRSNANMHRTLFSLIRLYSLNNLGRCGTVQTNHNLDTQYTTSEVQTRQETKIKKEN